MTHQNTNNIINDHVDERNDFITPSKIAWIYGDRTKHFRKNVAADRIASICP